MAFNGITQNHFVSNVTRSPATAANDACCPPSKFISCMLQQQDDLGIWERGFPMTALCSPSPLLLSASSAEEIREPAVNQLTL